MSDVITTSSPNSNPTMSSREIADLTGKAHKHVIRDIEVMISEIEKDGPDLDHQAKSKGYDFERDNRGYVKIIHLDRSHTITLITGYDARQRKRVVDRWLELENKPAIAAPSNMVEALTLALEQQKELQAKDAEIAELTPKAAALDAISEAEGDMGVRDAGRELDGIGQTKVTAYLLDHKWACREGRKLKPAHYGLSQGYCRLVPKSYQDRHTGETCIGHDFRITARGLARLAIVLCGINSGAARRLNGKKGKNTPVPFALTPAETA
ncbi:phage regulatory protein/antirepressor Ant [Acetobacter sp. DsW_059]|uniref:phage antirepressor KilAC domain-containing protein n=1 Tax=Acetobacter sp. DsW_059 TaxID=1670661 RepID=UPI000A37EFCD|nr:phage regulatory protein/antirepressor Ant [Acetobacter sp. DsW_059]